MKSENPLFIVIFLFSVMVGLVIDQAQGVANPPASNPPANNGAASKGTASPTPTPASSAPASPAPASSAPASPAPASPTPASNGAASNGAASTAAASPGHSGKVENGLWTEVVTHKLDATDKVTIIGAGAVGTAVAFGLMTQMVTDEIVLLGRNEKKVKGEVKDLQDGSGFVKSPRISGGTLDKDVTLARNSRIIIIAAGAPPDTPGSGPDKKMTKEELAKKNLEILEDIIPKVKDQSPDAVYIIVTNPVDIMAYAAWTILGRESTYQIIGAGTNLDSQRMRVLIAKDLHISPESVGGWIIGEQGDKGVIAWSGVNVAGVKLKDIQSLSEDIERITGENYENGDDWYKRIQNNVLKRATKDKAAWAVSLSITSLVYSIIHNIPNVHAVSTLVKDFHGIDEEVFMSLPCILGDTGVTHIIKQTLYQEEKDKLKESATEMKKIIDKLNLKSPSETGGAVTSAGGTANSAGGTANSAGGTANSAGGTANSAGGSANNAGGTANNAAGGAPAGSGSAPASSGSAATKTGSPDPNAGGATKGAPARTTSTKGGAADPNAGNTP